MQGSYAVGKVWNFDLGNFQVLIFMEKRKEYDEKMCFQVIAPIQFSKI